VKGRPRKRRKRRLLGFERTVQVAGAISGRFLRRMTQKRVQVARGRKSIKLPIWKPTPPRAVPFDSWPENSKKLPAALGPAKRASGALASERPVPSGRVP
jgi:hypothetical protein